VNSRAILGSTLAHAAAIWVLFVFAPPSHPHANVTAIQVALVNLPNGAMRTAAGEAVETPPPDETKPKPTAPAETPPVKNAIRPPDAKAPMPKRPTPGLPTGIKTESAGLGVPGLSGDVAVDDANFAFTYYLVAVRNRVGQNWGAPAGLETSGNVVRCMVYFRIDRLGRVSDVKLEESSGVAFFDQSAVRAVSVSTPLPPLPDAFTGSTLGVHFGFQFNDR
jgi:TonB family protein